MSTLFIRLSLLPTAAPLEYDYVLSHDGQRVGLQGRAAAALLPASTARGHEVVAVLSAAALSWHVLALPHKVATSLLSARAEPARVRAVLGGAMEDQLLDEPEQLHFAVFPAEAQTAGINTPTTPHSPAPAADTRLLRVAVCDRSALRNALQALEAAGLVVGRIVAEHPPLTAPHAGAQVLVVPGADAVQMVVCTAQSASVFALDAAAVALAQAHAEQGSQQGLLVQAEPAALAQAEQAFGQAVEVSHSAQRLLQAGASAWNLAQLEFSPSRSDRWTKGLQRAWQTLARAPQWRPVRWGALALVLLQVLALNALAFKEQALLTAQRQAQRTLLLQTFPQTTVVVDAPLQMQREVAQLALARGAGASVDVVQVLHTVAGLDPTVWGSAVLSGLDLDAQGVQLHTQGLSAAASTALRAALEQQGWSVRTAGADIHVQAADAAGAR